MRWLHDTKMMQAPALDVSQQQCLNQQLSALASHPLVTVLNGVEDLADARVIAKRFRSSSDVTVVIGTGGASLGAQALVAAAPERARLIFLDNIDPLTVERLFASLDKSRTSWIIASKSGGTTETLACMLALVQSYAAEGMLPELSRLATVITGAHDNPLRSLALAHAIPLCVHPDIGGRYSVFTLVGLLPALVAGMDAAKIRQGAIAWFARVNSGDAEMVMQVVAWLYGTRERQPVHVVMAYADGLRAYTRWFQQLWAESLGKDGKGTTPYAAVGTIDQHSQLQMFLDGPRDKSFTLVLPAHAGLGPKLAAGGNAALTYLDGHTMGDVMDASAEGTVQTLAAHNVPMRVLRVRALDEAAMGELLLMQMVETILVAALMGVDPYDQPAVEQGKLRTRDILHSGPSALSRPLSQPIT